MFHPAGPPLSPGLLHLPNFLTPKDLKRAGVTLAENLPLGPLQLLEAGRCGLERDPGRGGPMDLRSRRGSPCPN